MAAACGHFKVSVARSERQNRWQREETVAQRQLLRDSIPSHVDTRNLELGFLNPSSDSSGRMGQSAPRDCGAAGTSTSLRRSSRPSPATPSLRSLRPRFAAASRRRIATSTARGRSETTSTGSSAPMKMNQGSLLVVDDDRHVLEAMADYLRSLGIARKPPRPVARRSSG